MRLNETNRAQDTSDCDQLITQGEGGGGGGGGGGAGAGADADKQSR